MTAPDDNPRRRSSITIPVLLGALAAFWIGATIWAFAVTSDARECESAVGGRGNPQDQLQFDKCRRFTGVDTFEKFKAEYPRSQRDNQRDNGTNLPPEN